MTGDEKKLSKDIIGKVIVSKTGKRFGEVGDLFFETNHGELIHLVLNSPTEYASKLDLEKDKDSGKLLIPCSSIIAVGDFLVVSEEDLV